MLFRKCMITCLVCYVVKNLLNNVSGFAWRLGDTVSSEKLLFSNEVFDMLEI